MSGCGPQWAGQCNQLPHHCNALHLLPCSRCHLFQTTIPQVPQVQVQVQNICKLVILSVDLNHNDRLASATNCFIIAMPCIFCLEADVTCFKPQYLKACISNLHFQNIRDWPMVILQVDVDRNGLSSATNCFTITTPSFTPADVNTSLCQSFGVIYHLLSVGKPKFVWWQNNKF